MDRYAHVLAVYAANQIKLTNNLNWKIYNIKTGSDRDSTDSFSGFDPTLEKILEIWQKSFFNQVKSTILICK